MNGITHRTAGALVGTLAVKALFPDITISELIIGGSVVGYLGGIIPDIDQSNSTISNMNPITKITGSVIHHVAGHRTVFHSLILGVVLSVIVFLLTCKVFYSPYVAAVSFFCGFLSHLFLDMLNKEGVPLFYPWKRRFHIASFKSNGIVNCLLSIGFGLLLILTYAAIL